MWRKPLLYLVSELCSFIFNFELLFIVYFLISENRYNSGMRLYSAKSLNCGLLVDFQFRQRYTSMSESSSSEGSSSPSAIDYVSLLLATSASELLSTLSEAICSCLRAP